MDLIKKLGGYEAAKNILLRKRYNHVAYSVDSDIFYDHEAAEHGGIDVRDLDGDLLEYRRANNIFEVGDKVVSEVYDLESIFVVSHADLMDEYIYSNKVFNGGKVFTTQDKLKGECRFLFEEIRHATDEEIAAGHRL